MAIDFSTAVLKLAENGELQRIHDLWLDNESCTKRNVARDATELGLNTFWGLFLITGCASIFCCCVYCTRMIIRYHKMFHGHMVDVEVDLESLAKHHLLNFCQLSSYPRILSICLWSNSFCMPMTICTADKNVSFRSQQELFEVTSVFYGRKRGPHTKKFEASKKF